LAEIVQEMSKNFQNRTEATVFENHIKATFENHISRVKFSKSKPKKFTKL